MRTFRVSAIVALAVVLASVWTLPSPVSAIQWLPGPEAQGPSTIDGWIDLPAEGSTVSTGQSFTVAGWAVDTTAQGWAGIDEVHVYDGTAGQGGTFLGKGMIALSRPDVGMALGNSFYNASGFLISVAGLSAGTHTLTVYGHTPNKGWWSQSRSITVVAATATPTPAAGVAGTTAAGSSSATKTNAVIRIISPTDGGRQVGGDQQIKGWAADPRAPSGTGVDKVEVWLGGARNVGTFLGAGDYGQNFGTPEEELGDSRFKSSGWDRDWDPTQFTNRTYDLYVYAHSTYDGVWYYVKQRVVVGCGEKEEEDDPEIADDC